jgi:hypothetical protein
LLKFNSFYTYYLATSRKAVVLQVIVPGGSDQYIAFNSAKGANAQNDEADNLVTIVEWNTGGYSTSWLKGYIAQGESFVLGNGLIVSAQCINTKITPSIACVCVKESYQTCPSDCNCEIAFVNASIYSEGCSGLNACSEGAVDPLVDLDPITRRGL